MKSSKQELSCRGHLMKYKVFSLLRERPWVENFIFHEAI